MAEGRCYCRGLPVDQAGHKMVRTPGSNIEFLAVDWTAVSGVNSNCEIIDNPASNRVFAWAAGRAPQPAVLAHSPADHAAIYLRGHSPAEGGALVFW